MAPQDLPRRGLETSQSEGTQDQTLELVDHQTMSISKVDQTTTPQMESTAGEPAIQPTASTSKVNQVTASRRKPTRTASSSSLSSRPGPIAVGIPPQAMAQPMVTFQSSDRPTALKFFDPAIDLGRSETPIPPSTNHSISAEQGSASLNQTTQPLRRWDSLSHLGSFQPLFTPGQPPSSSRFPRFDTTTHHEPSPFARGAQRGRHIGRCFSVGWYGPTTSTHSGGSRPLSREDITRELQGRRDSHEDLNARRGTHPQTPTFHP